MIYPIWKQGDITLHGSPDTNQDWTERDLAFGVVFPKTVTTPVEVTLRSSASLTGSDEVLANIRLYLIAGPEVADALLNVWPASDCGIEVSFDQGLNWTRFSSFVGAASDPTTWILLPASAISTVAQDGVIGPDDVASLLLRVIIPHDVEDYGLHRFTLDIDFDVL